MPVMMVNNTLDTEKIFQQVPALEDEKARTADNGNATVVLISVGLLVALNRLQEINRAPGVRCPAAVS